MKNLPFLLLLFAFAGPQVASGQLVIAEQWLQLDYRFEAGIALSDEEWQQVEEIQILFTSFKADWPPLEELLGEERDAYAGKLEDFFVDIRDVVSEESWTALDDEWREIQRLNLPDELEAAYPSIGISYEQARRLAQAAKEENVALLESLSADRLHRLFLPYQAALYDAHNSMQEQELQVRRMEEQLARAQRGRNAVVQVLRTMVQHYLVPLRELRTQFDSKLSAEDRSRLREFRAQRHALTEPTIATIRENAGSVEELALFSAPFSYMLYHFPRDYRDGMPVTNFGESTLDPEALRDFVQTKQELLQDQQAAIVAIAQQCRNSINDLGDAHEMLEASREMQEGFLFPSDTLSYELMEVFLLMEPIQAGDPKAGYPSPFLINEWPQAVADTASVSIVLHAAKDLSLEIYRENDGEMVKPIVEHTYTPGEYQFKVDVSELAEGEYIYILTFGEDHRYFWPLLIER